MPAASAAQICGHLIFSSFTPFVPKQESARNTRANSFVQRMDENSPVVRWKLSSILSTTPMSMFHSFIEG